MNIIDDRRDGMTIPIVSENGVLGLFCPCGRAPNLSPRARSALEIVGMHAYHALHKTIMQEYRDRQPPRDPLTPREREILTWAAAGKNDDDIADILTISSQTVSTHMKNIRTKLDAGNRVYAVVQALRFGELNL